MPRRLTGPPNQHALPAAPGRPLPPIPAPPAAAAAGEVHPELQRARVTVAVACLFALVVAAIVLALIPNARHRSAAQPVAAAAPPSFPAEPVPVSMRPAPTSAAPSTSVTGAPATGHPGPAATRRTTPPPRSTTPAAVLLPVGSVVGLELHDRPGYRVRHRDFLGRIDAIGPNSRPEDRLDARFTVRKSEVRGCVSFESVNFPGYFLHHRNFMIHLDRADDSRLFPADSTFCPVTVSPGVIVLRSSNYPTRYVTEHDDALDLTEVPPSGAVALQVRAPV
jgi:hypothetical protein